MTDNNVTTLRPSMSENEYEWISHTAYAGREGCTLYRHRMSGRPVMVFQKGDDHTVIWLPLTVVEEIKKRF